MGLVNKRYLFRIFDLLGFEIIAGFAMAIGRHASGIIDIRACLDDWTTDFKVGEVLERLFGNVAGARFLAIRIGFAGPIMTIHAAHLVVFAFFPEFRLLLNDGRVGQNVAAPAKKLRLGDWKRRCYLPGRWVVFIGFIDGCPHHYEEKPEHYSRPGAPSP